MFTQEYRDFLASRAEQRLAADVLLTALSDWFVYHSKTGQTLRHACHNVRRNRWGKVVPGDWCRLGVSESLRNQKRLRHIVLLPDPARFLYSTSVFHEMVDVDPETFRAALTDPARARRLQLALKKNPRALADAGAAELLAVPPV